MANITWKLKMVKASELKSLERNPRTITEQGKKLLEDSLEAYGQVKDILVDQDLTVIGGNQRLSLMKPNQDVQIRYPDRKLTDDEVNKILLIHNNKIGSWDFEILRDLFDDDTLVEQFMFDRELLDDFDFDFDDLDFDAEAGKVIKKLIVNFKEHDPQVIKDMFNSEKERLGMVEVEQVIINAIKNYENQN